MKYNVDYSIMNKVCRQQSLSSLEMAKKSASIGYEFSQIACSSVNSPPSPPWADSMEISVP